jgi:hypothetical protein
MIYPLISTAASLDFMLNSAFVNVSEYTVYAYFIHDNNFVSILRPICSTKEQVVVAGHPPAPRLPGGRVLLEPPESILTAGWPGGIKTVHECLDQREAGRSPGPPLGVLTTR